MKEQKKRRGLFTSVFFGDVRNVRVRNSDLRLKLSERSEERSKKQEEKREFTFFSNPNKLE